MLRPLAKLGVARVLRATRVDQWIGRRSRARSPLVLGYHRVTAHPSEVSHRLSGMAVSRPTLERQLDAVGRQCRFVTVDELARQVASGEPFERATAAVTFDDGYADVYEHAFPLLRRKGIPAAVFVVTDLVGTDALLLHDRLYRALCTTLGRADGRATLEARVAELAPAIRRLPGDAYRALQILLGSISQAGLVGLAEALEARARPERETPRDLRIMDWSMLREMALAGITVGSHGRSHALLPLASPSELWEELQGSRAALSRELGIAPVHLAYPGGACTAATVATASEAGYRFAYTICSHRDAVRPQLTIPRRMLWERSGTDHLHRFSDDVLACQLSGVFDFVGGCRASHGFQAGEQRA